MSGTLPLNMSLDTSKLHYNNKANAICIATLKNKTITNLDPSTANHKKHEAILDLQHVSATTEFVEWNLAI